MINYQFGLYEETPEGKKFIRVMATRKCDSDAQAEALVRRYCERNKVAGVYIRRGDAEWFASP